MTQSARWFMEVGDRIFSGMGASTDDAVRRFVEQSGVPEGPVILFIQLAHAFAPEPITPEYIAKRTPYAKPELHRQQLSQAVENGWLQALGEGQYTLAVRGEKVAKEIFALFEQVYGAVESLVDAELNRIIVLLRQVVETAKALPEPAEKWALSWGSKFDRGPSAPLMVQVRRLLLDLFAYRDDAHIAAWLPYEVTGQHWETLTFVWRGDATNAAELAEKLPYRGYSTEDYAVALQELQAKGWLTEEHGSYVVTEEGSRLRQDAEETTDRYFDTAWASLGSAETEEIKELLDRLAEAVQPPEGEPT